MSLLRSSSTLHRLGLAGNALGDAAIRLILAAEVSRELERAGQSRRKDYRRLCLHDIT